MVYKVKVIAADGSILAQWKDKKPNVENGQHGFWMRDTPGPEMDIIPVVFSVEKVKK